MERKLNPGTVIRYFGNLYWLVSCEGELILINSSGDTTPLDEVEEAAVEVLFQGSN